MKKLKKHMITTAQITGIVIAFVPAAILCLSLQLTNRYR